jgi:hypothetical protein
MDTEKPVKSQKIWESCLDAFVAQVFLDMCIEEVLARNRHQGYLNLTGYKSLIMKFNDSTNRNYVRKQFT